MIETDEFAKMTEAKQATSTTNTQILSFAQNDERLERQGGLRLDHLGIAVKSIAEARGFYEMLGMSVTHEETVEHEQVKTAMLPMGESRIELMEATVEDSTIGIFIAKRGEGLHHVAVKVDRLDERFAEMQKAGVRLASDRVQIGAGWGNVIFLSIRRAPAGCWWSWLAHETVADSYLRGGGRGCACGRFVHSAGCAAAGTRLVGAPGAGGAAADGGAGVAGSRSGGGWGGGWSGVVHRGAGGAERGEGASARPVEWG